MNNFEKIKSCKSIDEMYEILNILCFETMKQTVDAINKRLGDKSPNMSILLKSTNLRQWLQEESK